MDVTVFVIVLGSFLAAFVNAAFATGGIYILLGASLAVLPVTAAIALQGPFSVISLMARAGFFWFHIEWAYVGYFALGCLFGVTLGAVAFSLASDTSLMLFLGLLMLLLVWLPVFPGVSLAPGGFTLVGLAHSIFGTMFGIGGILQPLLLRTALLKGQITGTLAMAMLSLDVMKILSYTQVGFDYWPYIPHIIGASLASVLGSWFGKRLSASISERLFRRVFRWLVTLLAVRLIAGGLLALAS